MTEKVDDKMMEDALRTGAVSTRQISSSRLYTFVDTAYLEGRSPETVAQQLCDGGSDVIQLRAKQSSVSEIRVMSERILAITARAGVPLIINDYPSIAFEISIPVSRAASVLGFHLGQEDFFDAGHTHVSQLFHASASDARPSTLFGLSSHSPPQARRAVEAGADYIAVGPVYATGTKPSAKPVTLQYVRWAAENIRIPWFAIGGINLDNLEEVAAAGAGRVCVVSAILRSQNVAAECRKFKRRLCNE